ncbi:MAG: AAA family ATPase [Pseudomonadota bacterium]
MTRSETPPFFILTGPPGSGKTTLLQALATDFTAIPEAARRVLAEQRRTGGRATGEQNAAHFVARMLETMTIDYDGAKGLTLFDRGLPDLLAFCAHYRLSDTSVRVAVHSRPYRKRVFFLPAWEEIYHADDERRLDFVGAEAFGALTRAGFISAGYEMVDVPKTSVQARAGFIRAHIES